MGGFAPPFRNFDGTGTGQARYLGMRSFLAAAIFVAFAAPALAQQSPDPQSVNPQAANPRSDANPALPNASGNFPILSPFQALGKIIQNPTRPPTPSPVTPVSGAPLPSAIPPNTVGQER